MYYIITYGSEVWNRGMEQRYGTDPSSRYGTGVWNGCGPGACSGPPILTCPHIYIYKSGCKVKLNSCQHTVVKGTFAETMDLPNTR